MKFLPEIQSTLKYQNLRYLFSLEYFFWVVDIIYAAGLKNICLFYFIGLKNPIAYGIKFTVFQVVLVIILYICIMYIHIIYLFRLSARCGRHNICLQVLRVRINNIFLGVIPILVSL